MMATMMNANGEMVDMNTGEVVGISEGTPTTADPRSASNIPQGEGGLSNTLQQLSWGFFAGLFALPDAGVRLIGKGLGMDDNNVMTLTKLFNAGERPSADTVGRYARAIGEGVGAGMPFTGGLAFAARALPMTTTVTAGSGVLKNIAADAIKFAQQSPKLAAATDIAFNAGYEALRQTVEETVDDENPYKDLYKELLPAGAFIGLPLAINTLPSVLIGKYGAGKLRSLAGGLPEVEADVMKDLPAYYRRIPGMTIVPKLLMRRAEGKLAKVFGPIDDSPEAQQALKMLEETMADPRFADAGFEFDVAERTLFGPLLEQKTKLLEGMSVNDIRDTRNRINENMQKLQKLMDDIAPDANMDIGQAFLQLQKDRNDMFTSILQQKKDLTESELERLSNIYGPMDMDNINDELRGIIYSQMEMDKDMRKAILSRMGMKNAVAPDGTLLPTRENGASLFPAADMEEDAIALIKKYSPERPSQRRQMPAPIRLLSDFIQTQQIARQKIERTMTNQLLDETIDNQLMNMGLDLAPDMRKALRSEVLKTLPGAKSGGKRKGVSLADIGMSKRDAEGFASIPTGIPGKTIRINPDQIAEDAARIAANETAINVNLPEGLDYLEQAMRFRNASLVSYNNALKRGRSRLTDAQQIKDTGDAVLNDMEALILKHVPRINREYSNLKMVVDDYRSVYESNMALLMTERVPRGGKDAYLMPNEKVMQNAFKSADNLRQLTTLLAGPTELDKRGVELLKTGAYDWLRSKKVFNKDGVIDPAKISKVLDENLNLLNALPKQVRDSLMSEFDMADNLVTRLGQLDQRMVAAQDAELDKLISGAVRQDADPALTLQKAIKDPAAMRTLVEAFKNNPAQLNALKRSVFDIASGGSAQGGALQTFLDMNEKSLKVLFDEKHLTDLRRLADLQRRVMAFADVTGQMPEFNSLDNTLKDMFGSGVQYLTTTMREAAVGRIRPETGMLALMIRLVGNTENKIYNRIFTKALEDKGFAARMTGTSTADQAQKLVADLQEIGINVPAMMRNLTIAKQEAAQAAMDRNVPIEERQGKPVIGEQARSMLRKLPPAPKLGFDDVFKPMAPTMQQGGAGQQPPQLLYPQLFPNDPLSDMLKQRAEAQGASQIPMPQ